jgi:hypothetical protein
MTDGKNFRLDLTGESQLRPHKKKSGYKAMEFFDIFLDLDSVFFFIAARKVECSLIKLII